MVFYIYVSKHIKDLFGFINTNPIFKYQVEVVLVDYVNGMAPPPPSLTLKVQIFEGMGAHALFLTYTWSCCLD